MKSFNAKIKRINKGAEFRRGFGSPLLVLRNMNTETKPGFAHTNNIPRIISGLLVRASYEDIISMKFRRNTNKGARHGKLNR